MKKALKLLGFVTTLLALTTVLLSVSLSAASTEPNGGITFTQDCLFEVSEIYTDMPMTIDATVKVEKGDTGYYSFIGNYEAVNKTSLGFFVNDGHPYLYYNFGGSNKVTRVSFGEVNINTGEPIRVTIVYDSTAKTITCYIDGAAKQAIDATTNPTSNSKAALQTNFETYGEIQFVDPHIIGADRRIDNTHYLPNGTVYSIALYSDARTAEEVAAAQIDTADEKLIAAYDFTDNDDILKDVSDNGYDIGVTYLPSDATGMTFTTDKVYTMAKAFDVMPHTFDAIIMLPTDATGNNCILGNYDVVANTAINFEVRSGHPYMYYNAGSNKNARFNFSTVSVNTGVPVRLTVVHDPAAQTLTCYVDGVEAATMDAAAIDTQMKTMSITEILSDKEYAIGSDLRSGNVQCFDEGVIYSAAFYSDVLTEAEIVSAAIDTTDENLIAAYDFTGAPISYTDLSGNGYDIGIELVVSFDGNGAFGIMNSVNAKSGSYTLPACSFTPPAGKTFAGWALSADGEIINSTSCTIEENTTFYAVWADMTVPEEGLTFAPDPYYYMNEPLSVLPHTFSAWVYVPENITGRTGVILGNWASNSHSCFGFEIYNSGTNLGTPRFHYRDNDLNFTNLTFTSGNVITGDWAMVTITVSTEDNKTVTCYVNGTQCGSKTLKTEFDTSAIEDTIFFGGDARNGNQIYFRGAMKELVMYEAALTEAEVAALYEGGTESVEQAPLAHYAVSADDYAENISDLSGNGNDFTAVNSWVDMEDVTGYAYSIAVIGDTQIIARDHPEKMSNIYSWIVDNVDTKNIQYVIGLGDITDGDTDAEWAAAKNAISLMDGKIPYSLIRGNHDSAAKFNDYFATETYMSGLEGFYVEGDATYTYDTLTVGDDNYLFLNLDYYCSTEAVEWAAGVVEEYSDYKVIVNIHTYLCPCGGELKLLTRNGICTNRIRNTPVDSQELWDTFVSQHENILMVLCGHDVGNDIMVKQDKGVNGNTVTQIFANPQKIDQLIRPSGMVAMMYFYPEKNEITVEYYSTIQECYFKESNRYTIKLGEETEETKTLGDANADGRANSIDLAYLQRHLAEWADYMDIALDVLDLNDDGSVNITDATIFARHLARWIGYELLPYTGGSASDTDTDT